MPFYCKYNLIYSKTDFCRGIINDFFSKSRDPMTARWGKMFLLTDRYLPLKALALTVLCARLHIYIHLSGVGRRPRE